MKPYSKIVHEQKVNNNGFKHFHSTNAKQDHPQDNIRFLSLGGWQYQPTICQIEATSQCD